MSFQHWVGLFIKSKKHSLSNTGCHHFPEIWVGTCLESKLLDLPKIVALQYRRITIKILTKDELKFDKCFNRMVEHKRKHVTTSPKYDFDILAFSAEEYLRGARGLCHSKLSVDMDPPPPTNPRLKNQHLFRFTVQSLDERSDWAKSQVLWINSWSLPLVPQSENVGLQSCW